MNPRMLLRLLPLEVAESIYDTYGLTEYWKHRFTTDVLCKIDLGYRRVGLICDEHDGTNCDCEHKYVCANCYAYEDLCPCINTNEWDVVPYTELQRCRRDVAAKSQPYMQWEHSRYFMDFDQYDMRRGNTMIEFKVELLTTLVDKFCELEADV
jgi:hypothetical protein